MEVSTCRIRHVAARCLILENLRVEAVSLGRPILLVPGNVHDPDPPARSDQFGVTLPQLETSSRGRELQSLFRKLVRPCWATGGLFGDVPHRLSLHDARLAAELPLVSAT